MTNEQMNAPAELTEDDLEAATGGAYRRRVSTQAHTGDVAATNNQAQARGGYCIDLDPGDW